MQGLPKSNAHEFLYDIDLAAKTVQLANVGEARTLPATVDATFVTWQDRRRVSSTA